MNDACKEETSSKGIGMGMMWTINHKEKEFAVIETRVERRIPWIVAVRYLLKPF